MTSPVDPRLCPLCGQGNACGIAAGQSSCWCQELAIEPRVLDRIPEAARDKACICAACAKSAREATSGDKKLAVLPRPLEK